MTYVAVTTERLPDGEIRHRCFRTTDGRDRLLLGCLHLSPSSAVAHSKALATAAGISPTRAATDDADPRVQRGACAICNHGRLDPVHDWRATGFHEYVPLRVSGDGSTPIPSAPQPGSGSLEPSPEPQGSA